VVWKKKSFLNATMAFRVAAAQCKNICPKRLNWPSRLAVIPEGHRGISKQNIYTTFHNHF